MEYKHALERLQLLADVGEVLAKRLLARVTGSGQESAELRVYFDREIPITPNKRLPNGEALARILNLFAVDHSPKTCTRLAIETGLLIGTVSWVLLRSGRFERRLDNRMLWQLRTMQAISVRAVESA